MNWKEKFDDTFITLPSPREIEQFIETEIIEKLIEDIHDLESTSAGTLDTRPLKAKLRAKWLGKD